MPSSRDRVSRPPPGSQPLLPSSPSWRSRRQIAYRPYSGSRSRDWPGRTPSPARSRCRRRRAPHQRNPSHRRRSRLSVPALSRPGAGYAGRSRMCRFSTSSPRKYARRPGMHETNVASSEPASISSSASVRSISRPSRPESSERRKHRSGAPRSRSEARVQPRFSLLPASSVKRGSSGAKSASLRRSLSRRRGFANDSRKRVSGARLERTRPGPSRDRRGSRQQGSWTHHRRDSRGVFRRQVFNTNVCSCRKRG